MLGGAPTGELLVTVTEAAAKKVLELRSREGKADARLRLFVKSGGCSGFAINNPNAVSSCACGSSFNTDGSPAKAGGCAH